MARPIPTPVYHFTHKAHLLDVVNRGLLSDMIARQQNLISFEAGHRGIKEKRRQKAVDVGRGGVIADYVPFYYAPRSPMLYSIIHGNVPTFTGNPYDLVYLRTSVEDLISAGLRPVYSSRHVVDRECQFSCKIEDLDGFIDWPLMKAKWWNKKDDDPDREIRRQAECLVHEHVPWSLISKLVVHSAALAREIRADLGGRAPRIPTIEVKPDWYFAR